MKIIFFNLFLILSFLFFLLVYAGAQTTTTTPVSTVQQELAEYIKKNYTKREVLIPMRDGVKLFTSIYEPKAKTTKYPILLNRTPYNVAPYGEDKYKILIGPNELFAREGYIFAYQDVRGRWKSEGEFINVRPETARPNTQDIDESTDTYDTVEWLVKNLPNNNGSVGMYGISYPGFYSSAGAINSHPALKAVSPQAPVSDWFHGDDMHHNGALFLAQNYNFFTNFGQPRPVPTATTEYLKPFKFGTADGYKFFLEMGSLKHSSEIYKNQLGTNISFWDEMMRHPNYDDFWKDRNILPKLKNIKAAVMTVGGWFDNENLFGALRTYEHIERQNPGIFNILVMGPWFHGGWQRSEGDWLGTAYFGEKTSLFYREKIELPFFNHFLKGKGNISDLKEVNAFNTGANRWESFEAWDPKVKITEKALYLHQGGKLSFDKPGALVSSEMNPRIYDEYTSDPANPVPYTQKITLNYPRDFMTEDQRFVANRPDVLVYQTEPLAEDLTVAGDIHPNLFVSTSGTDADYVVKIIDVFPDDYQYPASAKPPENSAACVFSPGGYQMFLRGEPFRARFRNSFETPEPMKPNQITKIEFEMPGITHTFKKGHRIMIQIQSTWFPLVDRNPQKFVPNINFAENTDFIKATHRIFHDGGMNSTFIKLPITGR